MGLFSRKSRTNADEFSREFYDKFVFGSVRGMDLEASYAEVVRTNISKLDSSFAAVRLENLTEELRAVHLEMTGTAWTHASTWEVASEVSKFTKQYLTDLDRLDLWDAMGAYNQIVSQASPWRPVGLPNLPGVRLRFDNLFVKQSAVGTEEPDGSW